MAALLDLHTHTLVSGHAYSTMNENIEEASKKGLAILGISDHSPKMPGSTHLFYFRNLQVIPQLVQGVRVLKGAELNIMDIDGSVDLDDSTLKMLDYTIASLHIPCYSSSHTQQENTQAYVQAASNPYIKILGHPDDSRYPIDKEAVVLACKKTKTLLEVNNSSMNPTSTRVGARENMLELLQLCALHQVPVIFGSDAHYCGAVGGFANCREVCQVAQFPPELIVNDNPELIEEYFQITLSCQE